MEINIDAIGLGNLIVQFVWYVNNSLILSDSEQ